jgi:hypothetical protein
LLALSFQGFDARHLTYGFSNGLFDSQNLHVSRYFTN